MGRLLAIDWGSFALRGAHIDDSGAVVDERFSECGMLHVGREFEAVFEAEFGDWMDVRSASDGGCWKADVRCSMRSSEPPLGPPHTGVDLCPSRTRCYRPLRDLRDGTTLALLLWVSTASNSSSAWSFSGM